MLYKQPRLISQSKDHYKLVRVISEAAVLYSGMFANKARPREGCPAPQVDLSWWAGPRHLSLRVCSLRNALVMTGALLGEGLVDP